MNNEYQTLMNVTDRLYLLLVSVFILCIVLLAFVLRFVFCRPSHHSGRPTCFSRADQPRLAPLFLPCFPPVSAHSFTPRVSLTVGSL